MNKPDTVYGLNIDDKFVSTTFTLEANGSQTVGLGAYARSEPQPEFEFTYKPDTSDVVVALDNVPILNDHQSRVVWLCHLDNYNDLPCEVTITRRTDSSRGVFGG